MKASIDIGSNSVLLLVGEFRSGKFHEELDISHVTGLGKGIDKTKLLSFQSMEKTMDALREYAEKIRGLGIKSKDVLVTATEASRVAQNSKSFFERIEKELGFKVNLLSSQGEAFFSAKGVQLGLPSLTGKCMFMDLGGASTELVQFENSPFDLTRFISLPIGSVRACEWLKEGVFAEEFSRVTEKHLEKLGEFKSREMIGVAGTITTLAAMMLGLKIYSDKKIHGRIFEFEFIEDFVAKLKEKDSGEIKKVFPVVGERLHTITGGALACQELLRILKVERLFISTYGLRHGLLSENQIHGHLLFRGQF
jgi:exopolyphosphatase/guanosine-5'-triphosphate,3'-diphosphate pyrophosphatase